jgi:hypothetical protein
LYVFQPIDHIANSLMSAREVAPSLEHFNATDIEMKPVVEGMAGPIGNLMKGPDLAFELSKPPFRREMKHD